MPHTGQLPPGAAAGPALGSPPPGSGPVGSPPGGAPSPLGLQGLQTPGSLRGPGNVTGGQLFGNLIQTQMANAINPESWLDGYTAGVASKEVRKQAEALDQPKREPGAATALAGRQAPSESIVQQAVQGPVNQADSGVASNIASLLAQGGAQGPQGPPPQLPPSGNIQAFLAALQGGGGLSPGIPG